MAVDKAKKPGDESKEEKPIPAPVAAAVEEDDDADELPDDPDALRAAAKKLARQLRTAQRKLEDAGLTKRDEKRLTDEVAKLSAKLDEMKAAIAALSGDEEDEPDDVPAGVVPPGAAADEDDDDWFPTLL